ncbi:hypothetical protein MSAN_00942200 [Mycena sanguinolenta]|uniref:Clavaminate synthase-like protein n=1 Tax=Mycena sanguinolenta TaxID=230812 RepID=A0A8H7DBL5_9AGAR|nr:hypothetical protein MSAN_00942200 [Mycena sanguinolenta]
MPWVRKHRCTYTGQLEFSGTILLYLTSTMPSLSAPPAPPRYVNPPVTREKLDFADIAVIDLSRATDAKGRAELAIQLRDAVKTQGFFYVINHGYTPEQTTRMFDIADVPFSCVGPEEKQLYTANIKETGSFQGYKPRQYWHIDNGVHDQLEHYVHSTVNRDVTKREHPEALRPFLSQIDDFARHTHFNVLHPVLRLLARGLELPEETLVDLHGFSSVGETYIRFMKYYPRSEAEEEKTKNVWLKGHTDLGSITVLYSQPVSALQILGQDGKWRWIRHIENALVSSTRATPWSFSQVAITKPQFTELYNHPRTNETALVWAYFVQPPADQRNCPRLGLFYFCKTDDDVKLEPLTESPVLKRTGITRRYEGAVAPTMETWRKARTSAYGQSQLKPSDKENVEEEVINGVVVKHYS